MPQTPPGIIVCGHLCLDLILHFGADAFQDGGLRPGTLTLIEQATRSTGGVVANIGLALHRLGIAAALMGKVGNDLFGQEILRELDAIDPALSRAMIVSDGEPTSFSVVVNPANTDRSFLHLSGTNDTFHAGDVDAGRLSGARLFHFGYPPIMRAIRNHDGRELKIIMQRAKASGLTTSLDMAAIDPASEAGAIDWIAYLDNVLPHVDLFVPSLDEILAMLDLADAPRDRALLRRIGDRLLDKGAAIVMIKLGEDGLYLRTTADARRLAAAGRMLELQTGEGDWLDRDQLQPAFAVETAGTLGAGDCAIAGLFAALTHGCTPDRALAAAAATGASCVERPDAISGIPAWDAVMRRIEAGWPSRPSRFGEPA